GARVVYAGGGRPGEPADVHLVDDRLVHRPVERAVALPVVVVDVDDGGAHRGGQVVSGYAGGTPVPQRLRHPARIGIDEYLVRVEPVPVVVRVVWPGDPVGVVRAGAQPAQVHVPEVEAAVRVRVQLDHLYRLRAVVLGEDEQRHRGRALGVHREVDTLGIGFRAERMGASRLDLVRTGDRSGRPGGFDGVGHRRTAAPLSGPTATTAAGDSCDASATTSACSRKPTPCSTRFTASEGPTTNMSVLTSMPWQAKASVRALVREIDSMSSTRSTSRVGRAATIRDRYPLSNTSASSSMTPSRKSSATPSLRLRRMP